MVDVAGRIGYLAKPPYFSSVEIAGAFDLVDVCPGTASKGRRMDGGRAGWAGGNIPIHRSSHRDPDTRLQAALGGLQTVWAWGVLVSAACSILILACILAATVLLSGLFG